MKQISEKVRKLLLEMQLNEITEYYVYVAIAKGIKDEKNRSILERIAKEEKVHSEIWKKYTQEDVKPSQIKIVFYKVLNKIFGYTFTLKLMENKEGDATQIYKDIALEVPEASRISSEENVHEKALIDMLDEERLQYVGSMVLGLNDALVELTGTLAGLTFAMQNTKLVALSGLVTGISATLSMMSSEYLSSRSRDGDTNSLKSAGYTGIMYIVAVILMVMPYLIFPTKQYVPALICLLIIVILVIFVFTYYVSVAKDLPFKKRFLEMASISMGVAVISFLIGLVVKKFLGISV